MNVRIQRRINKELVNTIGSYSDGLPIGRIDEVLQNSGFHLVNEDGTPFSAIFCGESSYCIIQIADVGTKKVANRVLWLSWHKMPSGKYEIVTYVS